MSADYPSFWVGSYIELTPGVCPRCGGTGQEPHIEEHFDGSVICDQCEGTGRAAEYTEGERCEVCGYWWWTDGKWHSLVPKPYVGIQEQASWTRCPDHHGDRPTPARETEKGDPQP